MPRLGLCGLIMGLLLAADMTLAAVYVPGQYKDGIYIRPHFLPPGEMFDHRAPLEAEKGTSARMPPKPAVLDTKPAPKEVPAEPPSQSQEL
jgi:hypothetical protein